MGGSQRQPTMQSHIAMFARRKEGFPSGGSCRVKRLMRGDKSALTKNKHSLRTPRTKRARSRTLYRPRTSQSAKNFPARQPPFSKSRKILQIETAVAVQGSSGRRGRFGGGRTPSERGSFPLQGLPPYSPGRKREIKDSATRMPSTAALVMPPAYPAPSPQG